ncbi:cytochrome P450 [Saccharothrix texasensis]|uniref:Cytochrome P450 n=1 Tax=Saccharothrix texasensis TaxID=103734 RepID=A0A3N1GY64_9PSEU|nr:cytochrome P450 [Saccharothrix texasensis]ROP35046.1 cytochrome P450 [Saccharothrix texasensis]
MTEPLDALITAARSGRGVTELERGLWLVTDPTETERLLASKGTSTVRSARRTGFTSWGPNGLDTWMAVRRAAHPFLTASRLTSAIPVIAEQAERAVSGWPSPGVVDVRDETVSLISAVNVRHLLGEPSEALSALVERELVLAGRARRPFPLASRRLRHAQRATYSAIRQHIRSRPSPTGLQAVLTDHGFGEHTVTLALRTMLLSSHHVPATALAWALHELSTHPDVQESARAEATAHPEPTADLPLCRAVIRETLRLHPPVWQLRRQLTAPTRGLPTGTTLLFSPYLNHRDPNSYPEPSGFRPQRWGPGFHPAPGAYLPFALGPRTCPASQLALTQLTVILAAVLKNHRLTPHRDPAPTFDALHAPRHLRLRVLPA